MSLRNPPHDSCVTIWSCDRLSTMPCDGLLDLNVPHFNFRSQPQTFGVVKMRTGLCNFCIGRDFNNHQVRNVLNGNISVPCSSVGRGEQYSYLAHLACLALEQICLLAKLLFLKLETGHVLLHVCLLLFGWQIHQLQLLTQGIDHGRLLILNCLGLGVERRLQTLIELFGARRQLSPGNETQEAPVGRRVVWVQISIAE